MKKSKKKVIFILGSILTVFLLILGIFLNYDKIEAKYHNRMLWNETVEIMDKVFDVNMKKWDFAYEYENTLERSQYKGEMRVWFTAKSEQIEEVLVEYKDKMENDIEIETAAQQFVSSVMNISKEELNEKGKTVFLYNSPVRELEADEMPTTCGIIIHTQENEDGTVSVLFYYCEG